VLSSNGAPLYIGVEGCTLAPSPSHKGSGQGGEEGDGGRGGAGQAGPQNPNPSQPRPGFQCAPLFLPLMSFFPEDGPLGVFLFLII
jgi:hypothetical protein